MCFINKVRQKNCIYLVQVSAAHTIQCAVWVRSRARAPFYGWEQHENKLLRRRQKKMRAAQHLPARKRQQSATISIAFNWNSIWWNSFHYKSKEKTFTVIQLVFSYRESNMIRYKLLLFLIVSIFLWLLWCCRCEEGRLKWIYYFFSAALFYVPF